MNWFFFVSWNNKQKTHAKMVIIAKLSVEGEEIKFDTLSELYSWEQYEEIKQLKISDKNLTKISKLPEGLLNLIVGEIK